MAADRLSRHRGVGRDLAFDRQGEPVLSPVLDNDKHDAVHDERHRDDPGVAKVLLHEVVEGQPDHSGGDHAHEDLSPGVPGLRALGAVLVAGPGVELVEVEHTDSKDGAELHHNEEHVPKRLGDVELDELVDQDHMAGRGDGQPLGHAFYQPDEGRFQQLDKEIHGRRSSLKKRASRRRPGARPTAGASIMKARQGAWRPTGVKPSNAQGSFTMLHCETRNGI